MKVTLGYLEAKIIETKKFQLNYTTLWVKIPIVDYNQFKVGRSNFLKNKKYRILEMSRNIPPFPKI